MNKILSKQKYLFLKEKSLKNLALDTHLLLST